MPTFGLTDQQIFSKALLRLGEKHGKVFDVSGADTSDYGVMAAQEYQSTRNEEIRANNWIFAMNSVQLTAAPAGTVNNTGFWYMYVVPSDSLRVVNCYSVLPQWYTTYPFKHIHRSFAPFTEWQGIIYTDLDNANDNPFAQYMQEQPLGTVWYDPCFVDALALRIASKIARAVLGPQFSDTVTRDLQAEYGAVLKRAVQQNAIEIEDDLQESGETFWTDRARWTS